MKQPVATLAMALLILCGLSPVAGAVSLTGRSSTQADWFADEQESRHMDVAEYLRINVRQFDAADTWQVAGYGRAWGDVVHGDDVEGRLYYLYLDKKGLPAKTDVRIGRQYFFVSAGSALVDGARIDTRPVGPIALTLVGGRNVLFSSNGEFTHGGDIAAGAQLAVTSIPDGSLNLSYLVTYNQSDLATEKVGLAADQRFGRIGEVYTQLRYDVLSEVWNEIEAGVRTSIVPRLNLSAAYFWSLPTFEATSIFSVFAVNRYQEASVKAEYELSKMAAIECEYRNESYGGGDTANAVEAGVRYRPTDASSIFFAPSWRNGTGGKLAGFELSGDTVVLQKYTLAAGLQYDTYQRDDMTNERSATRVWLGGDVKLLKDVSFSARVEDNMNANWHNDVRARMALNVDF
jgi:hypothetical protein